MWGTIFSCCDCSLVAYRKKEDPWNAIFAGGITGGILAARAGPKAAGKNAVIGSVILALIEGITIAVQRVVMPIFEKQNIEQGLPVDLLEPPVDPLRAAANRSNIGWEASPTDDSRAMHGFDTSSISDFDTRNDDWEKTQRQRESSNSSSASSSSWKFW